jgi:CheY-like chemotaxis protein
VPTVVYEILIVSHTVYSIVALNHHVRVTVPRHARSNIITSDHFGAALDAVARNDCSQRPFTHIIVNVLEIPHILEMVVALQQTSGYQSCKLIVVTTPMLRNLILEAAANEDITVDPDQVAFIFKLVKPSKLSQFFDPSSERCESADARRQTAQQVVMKQKAVFDTISADVGHRGLTVLLVEDNPVNQKVMSKFCKKSGLLVELANDGLECLRRYEEDPDHFALVLMDLHMPNLDGYQACARIRELERARAVQRSGKPQIPIIALSANVMTDVAERCYMAGFTAYLSKPVAFQTLSVKIAELLGGPLVDDRT